MNGLELITRVTGSLYVQGFSLTDVDGLANITAIEGSLHLEGLNNVADFSFLNSIESIGGKLHLGYMSSLINLTPFTSLKSLGGGLRGGIELSGLENLTTLQGLILNTGTSLASININHCGSLTEISQLQAVTEIRGLGIYYETDVYIEETALTNLDGLQNIVFNGNKLGIVNNSQLGDFCGIKSWIDACSGININGNLTDPQSAAEILGCP